MESGESVGGETGVYVPPRVVAMPYKNLIRDHPKSEKRRLIKELRDEVADFPREVEVCVLVKWHVLHG